MKVMIDTNVLISAALFKSPSIKTLMDCIFDSHKLVLTSSIVEEVKGVVQYKFPHKAEEIGTYFAAINFEYIDTSLIDDRHIDIRDPDDRKVIASAFAAQADVLITGDKDFFEKTYGGIEILTPADFIKKYANGV